MKSYNWLFKRGPDSKAWISALICIWILEVNITVYLFIFNNLIACKCLFHFPSSVPSLAWAPLGDKLTKAPR